MERMRRFGIAPEIRNTGLAPDRATDICHVARIAEWELGRIHMSSSRVKIAEIRQSRRADMTASPDRKLAAAYPGFLDIAELQDRVLANVLRRDLELMGPFTSRLKAGADASRELRASPCSDRRAVPRRRPLSHECETIAV